MAKPIKRRIGYILFGLIEFCAVFIAVMQWDTNGIMGEVRAAFYCHDFYVEESRYKPVEHPDIYANPAIHYVIYKDDPDRPNLYAHFNIGTHAKADWHLDEVTIDLKLRRIFAWHNFRRGTLWIKYSVEVDDANGNTINGSWNVPVKLTIERVNGKWEITDIYETP